MIQGIHTHHHVCQWESKTEIISYCKELPVFHEESKDCLLFSWPLSVDFPRTQRRHGLSTAAMPPFESTVKQLRSLSDSVWSAMRALAPQSITARVAVAAEVATRSMEMPTRMGEKSGSSSSGLESLSRILLIDNKTPRCAKTERARAHESWMIPMIFEGVMVRRHPGTSHGPAI
ncbi:hypothetical protein BJV74DRAFT_379327 [Russula compacta]|nr:hypothetical protein BJV74DRAFT_379327 [Russula compacta]